MQRYIRAAGILVTAMTAVTVMGAAAAGAAASSQGVSTTTIRVGIPYVDLSSLASQGLKLNQGSFPDAYNALIANLNAHGGISGRKIVAYIDPVNPVGTAPAQTACTQLTQDDKVFVAVSPQEPDCYLQANTPVINGSLTASLPSGTTPNFTFSTPESAYDPLQFEVFAKKGIFKGKKVGIMGATADAAIVKADQVALKKLHVDVVQTAINSAPTSDQNAIDQQDSAIIQRFKSAGVDEVVAAGSASAGWPQGLQANQSSYNPPWVAASSASLSGYIGGTTKPTSMYLTNMTSSSPTLADYQIWSDPEIQKCAGIVHKAFPSDHIATPTASSGGSDHSYVSVISACENVALFTDIAKAAGKNLTVATFTKAGYGLKNVVLPGSGGPVSFGPGRPYALGPVFMVAYDANTGTLKSATTSSTS
jgi:hypothetical protein